MIGVGRFIGIGVNRFRAGGVVVPPVLSDGNTVLWFDSAENITKDGSDFVSVWGDKSGLSHDLLQATGTNQPLWSADGVLFDGVDNFMKCASFTLVQPEIIYIVIKQVSWYSGDRILDGDADYGGSLMQLTATPNLAIYAGSAYVSTVNDKLAVGDWGVIRALFNGASSKITVNDTTPYTGSPGSNAMGGFTLGRRGTVAANYGNFQVKEVIIRKVADGATDEAAIYSYLASKYSIT